MRKIVTLVLLLLLFSVAGIFAQEKNYKLTDLIVTVVEDSLQCRVLEVTPTVYRIEKLDENGNSHTISMGRDYVQSWQKGYFKAGNLARNAMTVNDEHGVRHYRKLEMSEQERNAKLFDLIVTAGGDSVKSRVLEVTPTLYRIEKLDENGTVHTVSMGRDYIQSWTKGYFKAARPADFVKQVESNIPVVRQERGPQINRFRMGINGGASIALGTFEGGTGLSLDHLGERFGFQIGLLPQYVFRGDRHALGLAFDYRHLVSNLTVELKGRVKMKSSIIFIAPTYTYYFSRGLFNSKSYLDLGVGYISNDESGRGLSMSADGVGLKIGLGFVTRIKDNIGFDFKISFTGGLTFPDTSLLNAPSKDNVSSANFTVGLIFGNY